MKKKNFIIFGTLVILLGLGYFGMKKYLTSKDNNGEENPWTEVFDIAEKEEYKKYVEQTLGKEIANQYDEFYSSDLRIFEVKLGKKYGFIDAQTGKELTPIKYDDAKRFIEGFAGVKLNGKWGIINIKGEEITPFKYDNIIGFQNGLCVVEIQEPHIKYGFINTSGKEITPIKYDIAHSLYADGFAAVNLNNQWGFIDKNGHEAIPIKYDYVEAFNQGFAKVNFKGKFNLIGIDGKNALPTDYSYINFDTQSNTYFAGKDGTEYLIYKNGRELILLKCRQNIDFDGTFGKVEVLENSNYAEKYIYNTGKEIIYFNYDEMKYPSEDLFAAKKNGKWGFANTKEQEIIPMKYDDIFDFENGLAKVNINKKYGLINKQGQEIVPIKYNDIYNPIPEVVIFDFDNQHGILNLKNNEEIIFPEATYIEHYDENLFIISYARDEDDYKVSVFNFGDDPTQLEKYDNVFSEKYQNEMFLIVEKDKKWGVLKPNSEEIIPVIYDNISFDNNYFVVEKNKKIGILNQNNEEIIPLKYDDFYMYAQEEISNILIKDYFLGVKKDGKWGIVDLKDNEVIPFKYDEIDYQFDNESAKDLIIVAQNGKWGLIDFSGKTITPPQYERIEYFYNGLASVFIDEKYGVINTKGKEIVPVKYDQVDFYSNENLISVYENQKWGVIDANGKEIVPTKYKQALPLDDDIIKILIDTDEVENGFLINKEGKYILHFMYHWVGDFNQGLAAVSNQQKKYGYIDKTGKEVIDLKYDYAEPFSKKGFAPVKLNGRYGLIDKTGKEIVPIKYDYIFFNQEINTYELNLNEKIEYFKLK